MKRKELIKRGLLVMCLSVSLASASISVCYAAPGEEKAETDEEKENNRESGEASEENLIEITNEDEFLEFAENCKYDSYSLGRTVTLTADLDLTGLDFEGVAYFNGTFEGNGHIITGFALEPKGSDYGFFRYIGESGTVRDLKLTGSMKPSGTQENIGGLVGVNYGTAENVSFEGSVNGQNFVGAIAGRNAGSGKLISCTGNAIVLGTNCTGGIVGLNQGLVDGCRSQSSVNIEELEPTLDLGGVDLSSLNLTQNVVTRNDMGGIAGSSSGIIMDCDNQGTIGFAHTGYNVGGIAGSQSGMILTSTNEGKIYGRKDVGGIVGQAEPYVESEYLEDKVRQTQDDIKRLNNTLNNISSTMTATSNQVKQYTENINSQYQASMDQLAGNLNAFNSQMSQNNPNTQAYVDGINSAMDEIWSIQQNGGELTQEQVDAIKNQLGTINDNLGNLEGTYTQAGQSVQELTNNVSGQLQSQAQSRTDEIKNIANSLDQGVQSMANSVNSAVGQMNSITNSISDDLSIITGDEEMVEDISSVETAENMDGVLVSCVNYGEINGDLNVGGIAGTMNIEYDGDPEADLDMTGKINVRLRSKVNGVVIHSANYGTITAKKNCVGGIVGLQALGFIYDCEGYGTVSSDAGSYLGGIAGSSAATIEKSYSLCNVSGKDYAGGICGVGYTVKDCISISDIDATGEQMGSIAGHLEEEGDAMGNYFVSDTVHGIDDISYAGVADRVTYEEVMEMEGLPGGFHQVTVTFETEDGVQKEKMIPYGGSIAESDFPKVIEKEGYYVEWQDTDMLHDIRRNLTVTGEYVPWTKSVAGEEVSESGKTLFLVTGEFYEEAKLVLEETDVPEAESLAEGVEVSYAYSWRIEDNREKETEQVTAHFLKPKDAKNVAVYAKWDGVWNRLDAQEDGSYVTADLPYGVDFAVVAEPEDYTKYFVAGGAGAAVLVAGGIFVWRRKKKDRTRGK